MPEKIVSDQTQDRTLKPKEKEKAADEPVKEFKAKLNKWGFIHVPKKSLPSLPFQPEESLIVRIEGNRLVIVATTKNQPEKARPKTEKT